MNQDLTDIIIQNNDINDSEEKIECSICLENKELVATNCNHSFCENCLIEWLQKNENCPLCREKIDYFTDTQTKTKVLILKNELNTELNVVNQNSLRIIQDLIK